MALAFEKFQLKIIFLFALTLVSFEILSCRSVHVSDCRLRFRDRVVNPAYFSSGQFGWRCVRLPDSSSRTRPFLPCLSSCQLPLHPSNRCSSDTNHTWWHATPPRLGNGQNTHWPALLPQVRSTSSLSVLHLSCSAAYWRVPVQEEPGPSCFDAPLLYTGTPVAKNVFLSSAVLFGNCYQVLSFFRLIVQMIHLRS